MPIDPQTTALAVIGVGLANKVLGPTASYIGDEAKSWTEARVVNIKNIFKSASKKLGGHGKDEGSVPPRILKGIIDDGSFCDDAIVTEYFGGVLASSKSGISRDDRGTTYLSLISRLSSYQIRAHYLIYMILRNVFQGEAFNTALGEERVKMRVFIPSDVFNIAMDFQGDELDKEELLTHILTGLAKETLINEDLILGDERFISRYWLDADEEGLIVIPSAFGIELFFWVHGRPDLKLAQFLDPSITFPPIPQVIIQPGSRSTSKS